MARACRYVVAIDVARCKGCELCVAACPRQVLAMTRALTERGLHAAEIVRERECIGCLQCTDVCPDAALTIWEEPADG